VKIAVLELLAGEARFDVFNRAYAQAFRKQFYGVMCQAVAAWLRQAGHDVQYATYYGQAPPEKLVREDRDMVIVSAFTEAAGLAYALAKVFRARGAMTVLGGPHAKCFPEHALRFFDMAVESCVRTQILDLAGGHYGPGDIIKTDQLLTSLPSIAERTDDIRIAACSGGRAHPFMVIPMLSSVGCPYTCDFCVDWSSKYAVRPVDDLLMDLKSIAKEFPGRLVAFYDPNFAVSFEKTLGVLEEVPLPLRNPYIMEASLSVLKSARLSRIRDTNCVYTVPGIESWTDYGAKAATSTATGQVKFDKVVDHVGTIADHIPGVQANFMIGTESDQGSDPVDLTLRFFDRLPQVFPGLAMPIPFGDTPFRERLAKEGRLLPLPLVYYQHPCLAFIPRHYDPVVLAGHYATLTARLHSARFLLARIRGLVTPAIGVINCLRTLVYRLYARQVSDFALALRDDRALRSFHDGRSTTIPEYYPAGLERRLGHYAELLPLHERTV
jgi:hypothetical protein